MISEALVKDYFAPHPEAPWRWSADGKIVEWHDGQTIAFNEELQPVLDSLAPGGLPPFGALVLLLSACRDGWNGIGGGCGIAVKFVNVLLTKQDEELQGPVCGPANTYFHRRALSILEGLGKVAALPADERKGTANKVFLAAAIFEAAPHRLPREPSIGLAAAFTRGISPASLTGSQTDLAGEFLREIESLQDGLARFDPKSLGMRRRTGLEQTPRPAALNLVPCEQARWLLNQLRSDAELAGLARLAKDLMGVVNVPRALAISDDLPLGGVSDISNRGSLDRLLISELAHDDETLSVRVALNEALYLRRESPPRNPPERRAVLIDSGIRLWGIPRVFAAAVALALAAMAHRKSQLIVHHARHDRTQPADLLTRPGLLAHLEVLEAQPHSGTAVLTFLQFLEEAGDDGEAVFITHEDVLNDPDFRTALAALRDRSVYVATVSRRGEFRLLALSPFGQKVLNSATLSLDSILDPPKDAAQPPALIADNIDPDLPVILSQHPLPLLLPHVIDFQKTFNIGDGRVLAATRDGRLMLWEKPRKGAHELTSSLPRGVIHSIFEHRGRACAVGTFHPERQLRLFSVDMQTYAVGNVPLETGTKTKPPLTVYRNWGKLFLIFKGVIHEFDPLTGEHAGRLRYPPDVKWLNGRFFKDMISGHCFALCFNGGKMNFEKIAVENDFVGFFDREGLDGPWALRKTGVIYSTVEKKEISMDCIFPNGLTLTDVSADGHRLTVCATVHSLQQEYALDIKCRHALPMYCQSRLYLEPDLHKIVNKSIRRNFTGIGAGDAGDLRLIVKGKHTVAVIAPPDSPTDVRLQVTGRDGAPRSVVPFQRASVPRGARYRLQVAKWSNGARAYLDSRGMLHLISAKDELPQMTFVLVDGHIGVWTATGRRFGNPYFHPSSFESLMPLSAILAEFIKRLP